VKADNGKGEELHGGLGLGTLFEIDFWGGTLKWQSGYFTKSEHGYWLSQSGNPARLGYYLATNMPY
jgi:hypothetical protein